MTTPEQELAWRRRAFLARCRLCRWGVISACDAALSHPFLSWADHHRILCQRARAARWRAGVLLRVLAPTSARTLTMLCIALAVGAVAVGASGAPTYPNLTGLAHVIDGDTLTIAGTRVRLHGIDAPETTQTCARKTGTWACGLAATALLADLVRGRLVSCYPRGFDAYGRTIAVCYAGNQDINAEMVRQGFARAFYRYSWWYVLQEMMARFQRVGIWQGDSQSPWDYRADHLDRKWTF